MFRIDEADAAPENAALSEEERHARRLAQEKEARERWNRDLEEGRRAREARRLAREKVQAAGHPTDEPLPAAPAAEAPGTTQARTRGREVPYGQQLLTRQKGEALPGTPAGDARSAWEAGQTVYQVTVPLTTKGGETTGTAGHDSTSNHNPILNAVEAQGWRLEHASFIPSSRPEATAGDVVAIYIFRRID
jgi:hypothetical protein